MSTQNASGTDPSLGLQLKSSTQDNYGLEYYGRGSPDLAGHAGKKRAGLAEGPGGLPMGNTDTKRRTTIHESIQVTEMPNVNNVGGVNNEFELDNK